MRWSQPSRSSDISRAFYFARGGPHGGSRQRPLPPSLTPVLGAPDDPRPMASDLASRRVADSLTVHTTTVLPEDTNAYGNLFGGLLVALIDKTASITASRHAHRNV